MPNVNVFSRLVGAGTPAQGALAIPAFVIGTGTSATTVPCQTSTSTGAFLTFPGALAIGASSAGAFGYPPADGSLFKVRLVGKGNTSSGSTAIVGIQIGTSTTAGSNTTIAATNGGSASGSITGAFNYSVEATLIWDNVLQKVGGYYSAMINFGSTSTVTAQASVLNSPPYSATSLAALSFIPVVTQGTASTMTLYISEFVLEAV